MPRQSTRGTSILSDQSTRPIPQNHHRSQRLDLKISDKENRADQNSDSPSHPGKRKSPTDNASSRNRQTPAMSRSSTEPTSKRARVDKGKQPLREATQSQTRRNPRLQVDSSFYDPDQDENTKRSTIRRLRELNSRVQDSRAEFLRREDDGLQRAITQADELINDVKQTSVATVDSRLLVNVGDIAQKKVSTLTLGDSSTGIDVDDFLSECIWYMKSADGHAPSQPSTTQRRRRRAAAQADGEEEEEEEEDLSDLNFALLGNLCFRNSRRPCLSGFLLGPLSTQKKVRAPTQRRATQRADQNNTQATRPLLLDKEGMDKQEAASLTSICSEIHELLNRTQIKGMEAVEREHDSLIDSRTLPGQDPYEPTEEELHSIMRKHNISDNGGVPLIHFCVNPKSFGQTVENFFYISFLIKENKIGIDFDSQGLPALVLVESEEGGRDLAKRREEGAKRNQAVITLDFDTWEDLVQSFGISKSIIPHRKRMDHELDDGTVHNLPLSSRSRDGGGVSDREDDEEDEDMFGSGRR